MLYRVNIIDCDGLRSSGNFVGPAGMTPEKLAPIDPDILYRGEENAVSDSLIAQGFIPDRSGNDPEAELDVRT